MRDDHATREFLQRFTHCQRRIYGYIRAQVRCMSDADDVLQETSVVLWEKFGEFDRSADFTRWACGIARRQMLAHFRKSGRMQPLFGDDVDELFVDQLAQSLETEDERTEAMAHCIEELQPRHRELLALRYSGEHEIRDIATRVDRSESAIYKALAKIHDALFDCIELRMMEWKQT
ncbi:MAG: sigma-70 family RNA polymerase sigma factor [Planctomycetota bacterium]|nr:sigma-70 family RNA polymerase sigma factor [Planctomycetota bacterium]MDA1165879.1 sigma-70 family RNA polymerase sigma factor [Planctomycetota bacterium]